MDRRCRLVRYADDFVCLVPNAKSAEELERMLQARFAKFGLTLHPDKTRTISFGRFEREKARRQGRRPHTFDFLGFTHYCGRSRKGHFLLGRKTSGKKFRKACREMNAWLRKVRSAMPLRDIWRILAMKLRGHYQYYGVSGNARMIGRFGYVTIRAVYKWLQRRSQRRALTWERLNVYLARYPLPPARLVHHWYRPSPTRETG